MNSVYTTLGVPIIVKKLINIYLHEYINKIGIVKINI